jgi:RND family efflux transporter MFP subunit
MLEYTKVKAPFSGIITQRYVDVGALLPAGTTSTGAGSAVVTLMDLSSIRAQVAVSEIDASFVVKEQPVIITVEGLPGKTFKSSVTRFSYALDAATRCMLVESEVANPDLLLRPGMYATIKVGVQKHDDALLLPVDALSMEKANAFVYLYDNGKAKKTPITLGFNDGVMFEIAKDPSTGKLAVDESAQVLLVGKATMTADQPVKLK